MGLLLVLYLCKELFCSVPCKLTNIHQGDFLGKNQFNLQKHNFIYKFVQLMSMSKKIKVKILDNMLVAQPSLRICQSLYEAMKSPLSFFFVR